MKLSFTEPYFEDEMFKQRFKVSSGSHVFEGIVEYAGGFSDRISGSSLVGLVRKAVRDASKGHEYTVVGRISGYKYRIILRNAPVKHVKISSVDIHVYDRDVEKLSIWIRPA